MTERQDIGQAGEDAAALYLTRKGYEILERNYRAGQLELDLIARQGECLVFVEVRVRKDAEFGYPEESMGRAKINAVKRAAETYIKRTNWLGDIRFDFIAIVHRPHFEIEHFEDAYF